MRGDEETGTVVAAQIVEEEGPSRDGDTNTGGESGGDGDCGEHSKPMLEVCEAQDGVKTVRQSTTGARSCRRRRLWEPKADLRGPSRRRQWWGVR